MLKKRLGIRARVLAIALIPSLALLGIGVGTAGYLIREGRLAQQWADANLEAVGYARAVVAGVEQERMLSLWQLAGEQVDPATLAAARNKLDIAFAELTPYSTKMQDASQGAMGADTGGFDTLLASLPQIRGQIDAGRMPLQDTYGLYNAIIDAVALGTNLVTSNAPDAETSVALINGVRLLHAMEGISRSSALTAAQSEGKLASGPLRDEYRNLVGSYRTALPQLAADLGTAPEAEKIKAVMASPAWQQVAAMEDYLVSPPEADSDGDVPAAPMTFDEWTAAQDQLYAGVIDAWKDLNDRANEIASDQGQRTAWNSAWVAGGVFGLALVAFLLSLWLANRLIGRLKRLRRETLDLAEVELPETMRKLAAGEQVDLKEAHLDFGVDEIGSVAKAFNRAHEAAVSAAVTEARTREGVRAVFLNIAHRSQMVVHRQLEVLDEAEQRQEDPAMLETFFRLDHLATRERRNAENLIILGGGEPGRQWRTPVPMVDLVRSAIGESLEYTRVYTRRMPQVFIVGNVVADLIHLLAELVDNATAFSPPESRVEVSGNVVGKGVAIEVTDQGIGMSADELAHVNEMLHTPPDFTVETLSATSRLGLFIVSQLAARHGIRIQLTESEYGGIRAIVLLPHAVIAGDAAPTAGHLPNRPAGRLPASPTPGAQPALASSESASAAGGVATTTRTDPEPPTVRGAAAPQTSAGKWFESPAHAEPEPVTPSREAPAAEPESRVPDAAPDTDGDARPSLPRRRRQANLAPELTEDRPLESATPQPTRSAEQARDLMSAIAYGTEQGRKPEAPAGFTSRNETEGEER